MQTFLPKKTNRNEDSEEKVLEQISMRVKNPTNNQKKQLYMHKRMLIMEGSTTEGTVTIL